ncbi:MAG: type II toxin-antitoxin system Phd/YefM family antitoxin [Oscillospiraceae bacterium]|nr:type II toxin-antitoxin system Phd/YefM family antitoxin [Oscillospiraceae bacterium]
MLGIMSLSNALNAMIPITRFNRGEANKIFDEVRATGCKVVVKNNAPACVLLTPEMYQKMVDMLEDQYLLALAEERERNDDGYVISFQELLAKDGLTLEDIDSKPNH